MLEHKTPKQQTTILRAQRCSAAHGAVFGAKMALLEHCITESAHIFLFLALTQQSFLRPLPHAVTHKVQPHSEYKPFGPRRYLEIVKMCVWFMSKNRARRDSKCKNMLLPSLPLCGRRGYGYEFTRAAAFLPTPRSGS